MFPSRNSCNLFPLTTHIMLGSSFTTGDKHPADSSLEDPLPPLWHFPAPFIDGHDDGLLTGHLLPQAQAQVQHQILLGSSNNNIAPPDSEINAVSLIKETKKVTTNSRRNGAKQGIPRKKTGKKDRHSKIYTAHGPRDRRMRLSLQIARKFFDLQDVLGFDKASKTIEWLFSKSKAAIKELTENLPGVKHSCSTTGGGKSVSSNSESEVVSAAKDCQDNMVDQHVVTARGESMRSTATARDTKERKPRKASFNPVARECRDKARARARQRTREKMKMRRLEKSDKCSDESNPNDLERLQFSRPLETGEISAPSTQTISCIKLAAEEEDQPYPNTGYLLENQMDSVSIIEKFLGITRAEGSSSMFNHSHNIADSSGENSEENCLVFSGNWGKNNERIQYSYCTMTNIKESTGNARERNPSIIFMADSNGQEQNYSPIFMTQGENPSSNLMVNSYGKIMNHNSDLMNPSNAHEGRSPTSILISTTDVGFHSHYQENLDVANKYHNLC